MPRVQVTLLVDARPEAVWEVLTDPNYVPKLYPDILNVVAEPPGRATVGQWRTVSGRVGKRLIEFKTKVAEMVPLKKFVVVGRRGGADERAGQPGQLREHDLPGRVRRAARPAR